MTPGLETHPGAMERHLPYGLDTVLPATWSSTVPPRLKTHLRATERHLSYGRSHSVTWRTTQLVWHGTCSTMSPGCSESSTMSSSPINPDRPTLAPLPIAPAAPD